MKKLLQSFKIATKRRTPYFERNDNGFSLLELVVAVGIMLVLTVGGALSYRDMEMNSRISAYNSALEEVYISAVVYESDYDPNTTWRTAAEEWNYAATGAEACGTNRDCNDFRVWGNETIVSGKVRIQLNVYKPNTNGTPSNTIILHRDTPATAVGTKTLYRMN